MSAVIIELRKTIYLDADEDRIRTGKKQSP
jgi:hypothetical protein